LERQKIRKALEERLSPIFSKVRGASHGARSYSKNSLVIDLSQQTFEVLAREPRSYVVTTTVGLELLIFEISDLSLEIDRAIDVVVSTIEKDKTLGKIFEDMALSLVETSIDETTERKMGFARIEFLARHLLETHQEEKLHEEFTGVRLDAI
jgi:hypothetical protein